MTVGRHLDWDGWAALRAYGIGTIVDLRNDEDRLRAGGLSDRQLQAVRDRLLEPPTP